MFGKNICLSCLIYIFSKETKTIGENGEIKVNRIIYANLNSL